MSAFIPGFKTVLIGLMLALIPAATQYLGAVDWNSVLPAPWGMAVGGVLMIVMRMVTNSPIFGKPPSQ